MNRFNQHEKNINPATVIIAATLLILCGVALISRIQKLNTEHDWDLLIFTQQWPNTVCTDWKDKSPQNNCSLPRQKGHWTIHGIWPTKLGTKGPNFCNKTMPFDITALSEIKDELDEYWTEIEVGGGHKVNDFWKHEWLKHGTCASSLTSLNTESKYFHQALSWYKSYNMIEVLNFKGVHPKKLGDGYMVDDISNAVKVAIGQNPYIHCIHDSKTGLQFLSEIRICFDKDLVLTDCDGVKFKRRNPRSLGYESSLTNCPPGKLIAYPKDIPTSIEALSVPKPEPYLLLTSTNVG